MKAILIAGGKGMRLAPLTDNLPKPLVPVLGRPMIEYVLDHLKRHGIVDVWISVAHLGHMIEAFLRDGSHLGMQIRYIREPGLAGTGAWTKFVDWDDLGDDFVVANADNLAWIDLGAMAQRHRATGARATIAAVELPSEVIQNYELLDPSDDRMRLRDWIDRSQSAEYLQGRTSAFINSGWYIMTPHIQPHVPEALPISNETHLWPQLARSGQPLGFYHAVEPWFDSGTHERLARVEQFLREHPHYAA